ncbi:MAG: hypothetical protein LAO23_09575 [Acidobacteriia bacterium]|nr:hypothetical protein [Terriglobia bacterium]
MQRCGSGLLLSLAISLVAAFTGCLGKSSSNAGSGGVQSITLSPSSEVSLETGGTQFFSATAKDALGRTILGIDIQFVVTSGTNGSAPLSVASNGAACAGTWDPTATQCTPGTAGVAIVTAVASGHSSPATTVYVHQHIDSIQIQQAESQPPQYDCFSQGQTWQFEAIAYNNGVDISDTVGPMSWSSSNPSVVTPTPIVPPNQPNILNRVQTTARIPGITQLFASASGTTSAPFAYTTCLIQAIYLQIGGQNTAGNSVTVDNGGSVPVTAIAVDTLCGVANNTSLADRPLTWSTSNPEVIAFSNTTNASGSNSASARANLGGAVLTASCSPPSCNVGLPGLTPSGQLVPSLPIYASDYDAAHPPATRCQPPNLIKAYGAISVNVTSTSTTPTYTAWAATTGCGNVVGCTSALFSLAPTASGTNAVGTIVNLPRTPNSMMFNHQSSARVYFGTNEGLMYVDVGATNPSVVAVSGSSTPCNVSLCGKVLTISNDGKLVVVSDTVSTPSQVYIFDGSGSSGAPVDFIIPGETATAAAFSPDQLKLFILTSSGKVFVHSTVDALAPLQLAAPATDVAFSADGSFAYVAGTPASSISAYSTCSLPDVPSVNLGSVATSSTPLQLFPSPVIPPPFELHGFLWATQNILALEPSTGSIEFLTAQFRQDPIVDGQFTCNPPVIPPTTGFTKGQSFDLGQGNFTPLYTQLVADGSVLLIVAKNIPAVLLFKVSDGTTTSIPLHGGSLPLAASASTDGSQVYIAACDQYPNNDPTKPCAAGSVHIVNTGIGNFTTGQGDFQQVAFYNINDANNPNMCNNQGTNAPLCLPDLVAIKPR